MEIFKEPRYSWTQPVCRECYTIRFPGREPAALAHPKNEICCLCGKNTTSGIYIRIDPKTVSYPQEEK